jgi:hypothetical protein
MKNKICTLLIIMLLTALSVSAQSQSRKKDPVGQWKFEAPVAPEGYTSGNIVIGLAEKKYSASMAFSGMDYKFPGENLKVVKDSVFFSIIVEGESVAVRLKTEDAAKMTGTATYSGGVVPLTLSKEIKD